MNYLQWSNKLYNHFFNDGNINQEVVLYTDGNLFEQLLCSDGGNEDFLGVFNPQNLLSHCYPKPLNRLAKTNQITLNSEFHSIEDVLKYFNDEPNASFIICNVKLYSSDPLSYFPFIVLVIYAYSTEEGVFNTPSEKIMLGSEQNLRIYTFNLLKKLRDSLKNKYTINIHNVYGIEKGPNRYKGVFLYHSLFSQKHILAIKEIIRRHHISRPIYNDQELLIRFGKIDRINVNTISPAKLIINKIIDGSLYVDKVKVNNEKIKREDNPEIVLYPQIQLGANDIINQYSLKPNLQTNQYYPESISLKINGKEDNFQNQETSWYKSIKIESFDNIKIANTGISIYSLLNTEAMFFQQIGEVLDGFPIDNNFFLFTEKPRANKKTIFIGNAENRKKVKTIFNDIKFVEADNYIVFNSIPYDFLYYKGKIKKIESLSETLKLDPYGGYRIKNTGHDKIYPYFLLPKVNFDLKDNVHFQLKYQTISKPEFQIDKISISDNFIYQNKNSEYGKYAIDLNLYIKNKGLDGRNVFCIHAELIDENNEILLESKLMVINEFKQPELNTSSNNNQFKIIKIGKVPNTEIIDLNKLKLLCEEDFLTRIIATAVYENNVELNSTNIEEIIAITRFYKKLFLKEDEYILGGQIIKDLRALGYIRVRKKTTNNNDFFDEYIYQPSDLALLETSCSPQFYERTFFLSGLRSFEFVEAIIEILKPLIESGQVQISEKVVSSSIAKVLPPEIYLSFKNRKNLDIFLSSKINIYGSDYCLSTMIRVIPYNSNALDDLKKIEISNFNWNELTINLSDMVNNVENDCTIIVEGGNNNYSLLKAKNKNYVFIGKGDNKANYKLINTNLGFTLAYSSNKIPYVFSEHLGNIGIGTSKEIYINIEVKLPQDVYSKLVYLNGGLPTKYILKATDESKQICFHNSPNTFDNLEMKIECCKDVEYYKFDVDLKQNKQLEEILSTKIIYIQNAKFIQI